MASRSVQLFYSPPQLAAGQCTDGSIVLFGRTRVSLAYNETFCSSSEQNSYFPAFRARTNIASRSVHERINFHEDRCRDMAIERSLDNSRMPPLRAVLCRREQACDEDEVRLHKNQSLQPNLTN